VKQTEGEMPSNSFLFFSLTHLQSNENGDKKTETKLTNNPAIDK